MGLIKSQNIVARKKQHRVQHILLEEWESKKEKHTLFLFDLLIRLIHLLLAAVSLCALKYTAATGRPKQFSSEKLRVLKWSLVAGGLTVCLPLCLNKMNTNLWIPTTGFGVSYSTVSFPV